jgi:hypothetical protein
VLDDINETMGDSPSPDLSAAGRFVAFDTGRVLEDFGPANLIATNVRPF